MFLVCIVDQFVRNEIDCFQSEENGSVYFSSFNPVWPILGCGLSDGKVLIIEGKRQADLVSTWENKSWNKINAMSAMTDLGWNVNDKAPILFPKFTKLLFNLIDGRQSFARRIFGWANCTLEQKHQNVDGN